MVYTHKYKLLSGLLALLLLWFAWPVYQFAVEQGKAPALPLGFITIPTDAPIDQKLYNSAYLQAGERSLQLLAKRKAKIHTPAISAAVAIDGQLVWAGAVGWADIATRKPVTTQTQFRIGSTAKALTATGLARLVDAGMIAVDAPITHYMDDLPNREWGAITPRQLASHTAGLPDYPDNRDWLGLYQSVALNTHFASVRDALEVFDASPLLYQPGADFKYTTYSTVLLSAVMASASHAPYSELMQQQVFTPLGMVATQPEPQIPTSEMASFYWHEQQFDEKVKLWRTVDLSHRLAGGGFISTSSDLVRLGSAWMDEDFISPATRELFWTPQRLANGEENPQNYALGWRLHTGDEIPENMNHGGVSRGAQSWLMVFPAQKMVVAVNINAKTAVFWDFGSVAVEIAKEFSTRMESTLLMTTE